MGTKKVNLASALFSQAQQKVLGLLFSQPDKDFYTNEIIRLSKSGSGAIQRELQKLLAVGLITVKSFGNQHRYQANHNSPLFHELRNIILKTFGLADVIIDILKPIKKNIKFAFVYGSIARQEAIASSDIDLMLISENISYADLYPIIEKGEKILHRPINPTIYSPNEWISKIKHKNHFLSQVLARPKIFIIGTEDELRELK
jgi:predicted nucleotidyltransferase